MNDKFLKYKKIYDDINDLYSNNKCRTIDECCRYLNISKNKYYYFCLKYQMQSIFKINKNKLPQSQYGGFKNKMNINNNKYLKVKMVSKTHNDQSINNNENDNIDSHKNNKSDNNEKIKNMTIDVYNSNENKKRSNAYTENSNNISYNTHNEKNKDDIDIEKLKNIYKMQEFVKDIYQKKILKNNQ